jgi:hypothetical protein
MVSLEGDGEAMQGSNLGFEVLAAVWLSDPLNHLDGAINLGLQSRQHVEEQ